MAKALTIKVKPRDNTKPNALRRSGFVPATVYGHGYESKSVQVNAKEFSLIPHKAYSHINEIEIDGGDKFPVLIRNVQIDPVKDNFLNIEFYKIRSDEKIKVKVSLNYTGHSSAVVAGGVLIVSLNEVEIQCLPKDIPDVIDVSLEQIVEIGQGIHTRDLKISNDIVVLNKPDEVLARVEIAKTHEIEEVKEVAAAVTTEGVTRAEGVAVTPAGKEAAPATKAAPAAKAATEQKPGKGKEK